MKTSRREALVKIVGFALSGMEIGSYSVASAQDTSCTDGTDTNPVSVCTIPPTSSTDDGTTNALYSIDSSSTDTVTTDFSPTVQQVNTLLSIYQDAIQAVKSAAESVSS